MLETRCSRLTVDHFRNWINTGEIHLRGPVSLDRHHDERFQYPAELFVLAEQARLPKLKEDAIAQTVKLGRELGNSRGRKLLPRPDTVAFVYEHTQLSCMMRRLLVRYFILHGNCVGRANGLDKKWFVELGERVLAFEWDICIACRCGLKASDNLFVSKPRVSLMWECGFFCSVKVQVSS